MRIGILSLVATLAFGVVIATGCGGGGSSASAPSLAYTGKTTPAVITSFGDADTLTGEAVAGSQAGATVLGAQVHGSAWTAPALSRFTQALRQVAGQARPGAAPAAGAALQFTEDGPCGGTAYFNGTSTASAGSFAADGWITANGYCSVGSDGTQVLLTGTIQFSMSGTDEYDFQFSMSSGSLTVVEGTQVYTFNMNYQSQVTGGVEGAVTLTCIYKAPDGRTYQVVGYTVAADGTSHTLSITGRFYDPDYGYVDVTTPNLLTYTYCSTTSAYLPTSGTIQVAGANGAWGQFSSVDCQGYQVCYNLDDGLGTFCQSYTWQ